MTDDKLYTSLSANTIMAKQTNHVQRTRLTTSSTDKHCLLKMASAQVVETSVTNNSSFQNYLHPEIIYYALSNRTMITVLITR